MGDSSADVAGSVYVLVFSADGLTPGGRVNCRGFAGEDIRYLGSVK
jgi:hypothetical protein